MEQEKSKDYEIMQTIISETTGSKVLKIITLNNHTIIQFSSGWTMVSLNGGIVWTNQFANNKILDEEIVKTYFNN